MRNSYSKILFRCGILLILGAGILYFSSIVFAQLQLEDDMTEEKFIYPEQAMIDPFVSLLTTKGTLKSEEGPTLQEQFQERLRKIHVNGVLWDKDNPLVMINNEIYKPGDIISGVLVETITANGIMLKYKGLTKSISLIDEKYFD